MDTNTNATNSASQTQRILAYLQEGNTITPLEALRKFSCLRLGARIADISKIIGRPVSRKRIQVSNAEGKIVYVMQYSL